MNSNGYGFSIRDGGDETAEVFRRALMLRLLSEGQDAPRLTDLEA